MSKLHTFLNKHEWVPLVVLLVLAATALWVSRQSTPLSPQPVMAHTGDHDLSNCVGGFINVQLLGTQIKFDATLSCTHEIDNVRVQARIGTQTDWGYGHYELSHDLHE